MMPGAGQVPGGQGRHRAKPKILRCRLGRLPELVRRTLAGAAALAARGRKGQGAVPCPVGRTYREGAWKRCFTCRLRRAARPARDR